MLINLKEDVMSRSQVARRLNVTPQAVCNWDEFLRPVKLDPHGPVLYFRYIVEEFARKRGSK